MVLPRHLIEVDISEDRKLVLITRATGAIIRLQLALSPIRYVNGTRNTGADVWIMLSWK